MIAGAILIHAGTFAFCMGTMLEYANWFHQRDLPKVMEYGGGGLFVVGAGFLVWGLVKDKKDG